MTHLLAVDGGNSKTDVVLLTDAGEVLATGRTGGFHPHSVGAEEAVARLAPCVEQVLAEAGVARVDHVSACLANVDLPAEEVEVLARLEKAGWGAETVVANDTFAVLRSGTDEPRGVAVVCGAGINCVGLLPDGRSARFPALGMLTGDWGGGMGLASELMWAAARCEDGRGRRTLLAERAAAHFGLPTAVAVAEAVHLRRIDAGRLHELVPVLFAAAREGDAVALEIVARQAEEIALLSTIALTRLGMLDAPAPVVLGGGVLAAREPLLVDGIAERLARTAPWAVPHVVDAPPVLGAALLGLDLLVSRGLLADDERRTAEQSLRMALGRGRAPAAG
ncbi:N-acetylglucosamine kinase-like BadF-type ATPase [Motilibacter peucedani]|uniref:N-acetylglucosamine kinase-like BadF-type ATPase n=1 Tax=Motilibacter peucedani TaxID=598650 RepID=A0A420XRY7_9ACTN|nr:BadF/BadG/BcrA/BcrD ATPase family protein [Motilibacter peucedani]RKS77663.1 N-acetylglucosamine kinase-like BadF-type ATPase [Motilibacter peucedani]